MSLLLNVPYTYRKDGIYYLQRYVPEDVRQHYKTNRISFSLRTKSAREAMALARSASAKLEAYWHSLCATQLTLTLFASYENCSFESAVGLYCFQRSTSCEKSKKRSYTLDRRRDWSISRIKDIGKQVKI